MYCVMKFYVHGHQARVKNADLRHPSCTVVIERRKSASPVRNVLNVPDQFRLLIFHVPKFILISHCLCRSKKSSDVLGFSVLSLNLLRF